MLYTARASAEMMGAARGMPALPICELSRAHLCSAWWRRAMQILAVAMLTPLAPMTLEGCAPRTSSEASAAVEKPTLPAGPDGSLLSAAVGGDIFGVERLLNEGVNVNARASNGTTALMGAAYSDYPRTTRLLIARGAEVNARSADGLTALHYAAGAGNTEIVDILLMAGADPNALSVDGTTPLMRAARAGRDKTVKRLIAGGALAEATPGAGPR